MRFFYHCKRFTLSSRRTADVRSVGYSELFSLSREDVLAAMKDYPEAQDILQTLGRKRLQEAKNMARKYAKGKRIADLKKLHIIKAICSNIANQTEIIKLGNRSYLRNAVTSERKETCRILFEK